MLKTVGNPALRYGDQTIVNGNLVIGTAGKGIDFSADPSAPGMTSELLDDYEEGTWTPTFGGSTTYYGRSGTYTKVGRIVYIDGFVHIDTNGSGSQNTISGLPFTPAGYQGGAVMPYQTGLGANVVSLAGRISLGGGGSIAIYSRTAAANAAALNNVAANAAYFEFTGWYYV